MYRIFKKEQILTIPNLLSAFRVALIPVIIWQYCVRQNHGNAVAMIVLSGVTDVMDGFIARRWNMVSDLGKILDPVADKLTQGALAICLLSKYKLLIGLLVLFAAKEVVMLRFGYLALKKKDSVSSADWHGKVNTVLLYFTMILLILFPGIPMWCANTMILCCIGFMLYSFARYAAFYKKLLADESL